MGGYKFIATTMALLIFSFIVLAPGYGNGGEVFFDMNVSEEDLQVVPNSQTFNPEPIDLSDTYERNNIEVIDPSNLSDPEYNTSQAVRLDNTSESGYVVYETPDVQYIKTLTTKYGFLEGSNMEGISLDGNFTELDPTSLNGETSGNTDDETEYLKIEFENDPAVLYEVETSQTAETSGLDAIYELIVGVVSFPITLWTMFRAFPLPVQLFYGAMLTWVVIEILQVG